MFYYIDFASQNQPQNSRISGRYSRKVGFRQAKAMVIVMELWQHTKTMDIEYFGCRVAAAGYEVKFRQTYNPKSHTSKYQKTNKYGA